TSPGVTTTRRRPSPAPPACACDPPGRGLDPAAGRMAVDTLPASRPALMVGVEPSRDLSGWAQRASAGRVRGDRPADGVAQAVPVEVDVAAHDRVAAFTPSGAGGVAA